MKALYKSNSFTGPRGIFRYENNKEYIPSVTFEAVASTS